MEKLNSTVEPDYLHYVDEIVNVLIPADREEQAFDDCIRFVRERALKERAKDLENQLEMGEGTLGGDKLRDLQAELVEIQIKLRKV